MKDINEVNPGLLGVTEQGVQLFGHVVRYLVRVQGVEEEEEEEEEEEVVVEKEEEQEKRGERVMAPSTLARKRILLIHRYSRVIVKSLCHQMDSETTLLSIGFLKFGSFILEPNLDLRLVQTQVLREVLASLLCQVFILLKLFLESSQLFRGEGGARPLLLGFLIRPFHSSGSRT